LPWKKFCLPKKECDIQGRTLCLTLHEGLLRQAAFAALSFAK